MRPGRKTLDSYKGIASAEDLEALRATARDLTGTTVVHVNATSFGGGVAEMMHSIVPLMNDLGIRTDWRVLYGSPDFFAVTKKIHNALQGNSVTFSDAEFALYRQTNAWFAEFAFLDHDVVIVHDPQPCGLVAYVGHTAPWVWRCHIDITRPSEQAWRFIAPYVERYERMIVSAEPFRQESAAVHQQIIQPSIDPLSPKNAGMSESAITACLSKHRVPTDKPLVTQVSRFDPWKDPEGVLAVYELVRSCVDCRLVFCYNLADDDPEGRVILDRVLEAARPHMESGDVLLVRGDDPAIVNALQRASAVVLQKSIREGFGLTVTEAMWKGTPVVASNVGGIPTQIVDGVTGFVVEPKDHDAWSERVVALLEDPQLAASVAEPAREHVRRNFLVTRHVADYLDLISAL